MTSQYFVRYNLPAADYIAAGRIDARDDRERVVRAAERSQADVVIARLPEKHDQMVGKHFKELSEGRTGVLISHRFSSVRMADRILVLADGKVEAEGTHDELVARPGRCAELLELQAAGYR